MLGKEMVRGNLCKRRTRPERTKRTRASHWRKLSATNHILINRDASVTLHDVDSIGFLISREWRAPRLHI